MQGMALHDQFMFDPTVMTYVFALPKLHFSLYVTQHDAQMHVTGVDHLPESELKVQKSAITYCKRAVHCLKDTRRLVYFIVCTCMNMKPIYSGRLPKFIIH